MSKKPKIKEVKVEKLVTGQTVVVTVYEAKPSKENRKIRTKGRQTKDFDLIGQWQRRSV